MCFLTQDEELVGAMTRKTMTVLAAWSMLTFMVRFSVLLEIPNDFLLRALPLGGGTAGIPHRRRYGLLEGA